MKKFTFIAAANTIVIVLKGRKIQFTRENKNFDEIKECIRNGDEDGVLAIVDIGDSVIPEYSKGLFRVDRNNETIIDIETNTPLNKVLSTRIVEWAKEGFPFEPLLKFHRKVQRNPSTQSANELYQFLEANLIPITDDGNFVAYKKVTTVGKNLLDSHSRTINNNVGNIVSIPREKVNPDRNQTCSYGLHVGAWEYVSSFTGDTVIEVEVEPQDVVSVPTDYKAQKMRVCRYKVLGISGGEIIKTGFVKVHKSKGEEINKSAAINKNVKANIVAKVENVDFSSMTARDIKEYIKENYKIDITLDNKNKKAIIKKAYKIIAEA